MLPNELSTASKMHAWRLLSRVARPQRRRIILLLVLVIAQSSLLALPPWLVSMALDVGIPDGVNADWKPLFGIGGGVAACAVATAVLSLLWRQRTGQIGQLVVLDLRLELFAKFQRLSIGFHDQFGGARMIARLTSDMESINALFGVTLAGLLQSAFAILTTITAMILLDAQMAAVAFGVMAPLAVLLTWAARRFAAAYARNRASVAEATALVVQSLGAVRAAQAFGREPQQDQILGGITERMQFAGRQIQRVRGVNVTIIELTLGIATIVVLVLGVFGIASGETRIGLVAAFVIYIGQLFYPFYSMASFLDALQAALLALGKVAEVLDAPIDVPEPLRPTAMSRPIRGEVVLKSIRFAYDLGATTKGSGPAAAEISLRLAPGEVVAMLGATGAGKSTIAKLIVRFYDPVMGRVLLDGVDVRQIADHELRQAVVMLTQEVFLFAGSVADNIRVGKPSASDDEVRAAAVSVGADPLIQSLPQGYQTDVRSRGAKLSAGQRQMISFARAFLANPAVVILDEATSALDIPTEHAMQGAMQTLLKGRTALVIAHRLSTLQIADRVVVIADGKIVDDETPANLLARGTGEFAELYRDAHGQSLQSGGHRL